MIYDIVPVSKPRMTQSDKWKKRKCTAKYWAFKDEVRDLKVNVPDYGAIVRFNVPMPKSWSKKDKIKMLGQPHQQKPDVDNYLKALLDSIFDDDSGVYDIRAQKYWAEKGSIEITCQD